MPTAFGANSVASALGSSAKRDPGAADRTYHGRPSRPLKTGTFYFARKRNFLLCLDIDVKRRTAEIAPGGYTNWHCHNGATFFVALQGIFEAEFEEEILVRARAGDVYREPIAKFHRGHNQHPRIPYLCIGFCLTSPGREHVTNVVRPW
jgi:quercetin dioxygenase-like cupin family protein